MQFFFLIIKIISCDLLVLNTESEWSWIKIDTIFYSNYIFRRSYNFWITRFWLYIYIYIYYYYFLFFALIEFKFLGIFGIIGLVFLILNLIWGAVWFVRCDFDFDFFFFHIFPGSEFLNSINPMCVWTFMNQNWLLYLVTRKEFMLDFAFIFFFGWIFKCLNLV